jgi:hypothetical protein
VNVEQVRYSEGRWHGASGLDASWVLCFGGTEVVADPALRAELVRRYPNATLMGCSTAGTVEGARIYDDAAVVTAVRFDHTRVRVEAIGLDGADGSYAAGAELGRRLAAPELVHVFLLSEGIHVNGSALVAGLLSGLPGTVTVSGGLAADGARMSSTVVLTDGGAATDRVVAAGFYGGRVRVRCGSLGGWDPFGPERIITRASGNVVYELDEQPALALYERYLGAHAAGLPASGLLFPLEVRPPDGGGAVTRTLLAVDRAAGSITFAGDMPTGHVARLMRANIDRLVDGATGAARACAEVAGAELALVVSCAGRRIVMGQRTEEELDALATALGGATMTGFYSNGELSPAGCEPCTLHNQTMTITTLWESR